ncbi:MAG: hypothetical protein ACFFD6_11585 [Candidatus Thorarchaeota archaeon]
MCEAIVLNNGTKWKTVTQLEKRELASGQLFQDGEMVLICPSCHVAYVVKS